MRISTNPRLMAISLIAALLCGSGGALLGVCGPFTDVAGDAFCPFVLEVFYLGITTGTTPTTYDPASAVSRLQMAAFLSRSVDRVVHRTSRRAALGQFWTQQKFLSNPISIGGTAQFAQSDGTDVWVASRGNALIQRVRGSDGTVLQTWTGGPAPSGLVVASGTVWATGFLSPGRLYGIVASNNSGFFFTAASNLGANPFTIAYDGARFFTANSGPPGSVSIVTPTSTVPFTVTTVTTGFSSPGGILFDGSNMWVTDDTLKKLGSDGAILQTVTVGAGPLLPVFDGTNIWVPNGGSASVSVVRSSTGTVLATLTAGGLVLPTTAVFDGERILVTDPGAGRVFLWKAADLAPIVSVPISVLGGVPYGGCSDGIGFWLTLNNGNMIQF